MGDTSCCWPGERGQPLPTQRPEPLWAVAGLASLAADYGELARGRRIGRGSTCPSLSARRPPAGISPPS